MATGTGVLGEGPKSTFFRTDEAGVASEVGPSYCLTVEYVVFKVRIRCSCCSKVGTGEKVLASIRYVLRQEMAFSNPLLVG